MSLVLKSLMCKHKGYRYGESGLCTCIEYTCTNVQVRTCTCLMLGETGIVWSSLTSLRLQLLAFLKSDWSDAWLLLLIVTRTVNSIEPASYSRNLVHITYYSGY